MKKNIYTLFCCLIYFGVIGVEKTYAQDPIFSQFFSSPLSINPSLAGNGSADWRLVGNLRNQTIGTGGRSLNTTSLSFDGKLFRQKDKTTNYIGGGLLFLQDAGLDGAYKSNSFQFMASSHVSLDDEDANGLSVGLGAAYSNTIIDFSQLSFGQQLASSGFNRALPANEPLLSNVKPYFSLSAGITYTYTTEEANFDIGFSGYRFMKTNRSALGDPTQLDPPRYNLHADYQTYLNERTIFSANGMYVMENGLNTYTAGVNVGRILDENELPAVLNLGLFYRGNEAVIPYVGMMYKNLQAGITYDINVASSSNALGLLKTYEFSLVFRSPKRNPKALPCPWK
jgi:type IX secretion system PorP/SprF family membrane protein